MTEDERRLLRAVAEMLLAMNGEDEQKGASIRDIAIQLEGIYTHRRTNNPHQKESPRVLAET